MDCKKRVSGEEIIADRSSNFYPRQISASEGDRVTKTVNKLKFSLCPHSLNRTEMFALFHTVTADDATPCTLLEHGPQEIEIFMNKIDDNVPYANGPMIISFERALRIVSPLRGFDRPRPFIDLRVFVDFRVISGFHFEVDESTRVCNSVRIHTGTLGPCRSNGWIHGLVVGSFSASQSATCRLSTSLKPRDVALPFVGSCGRARRRESSPA